MPRYEKFSEKSVQAFSSRNQMWEGVESTEREEEGERERERESNIKIERIEGTYTWKMHQHVTCNSKNIMGSAQSNPTSTHAFNIINTHL